MAASSLHGRDCPTVLLGAGVHARSTAEPNTRVQASDWIYENSAERRDARSRTLGRSLPLRLPGKDRKQLRESRMTLYDDETPDKVAQALGRLDQADYVILASNRLYGSIPRLPERYPMAIEYYRALFDGGSASSWWRASTRTRALRHRPRLDARRQEDFTVYDHPTVHDLQEVAATTRAGQSALLGAVPLDGVERTRPIERRPARASDAQPDRMGASQQARHLEPTCSRWTT